MTIVRARPEHENTVADAEQWHIEVTEHSGASAQGQKSSRKVIFVGDYLDTASKPACFVSRKEGPKLQNSHSTADAFWSGLFIAGEGEI